MLGSNLQVKLSHVAPIVPDLHDKLREWLQAAAGAWLTTQKTETALEHVASHVCGKQDFYDGIDAIAAGTSDRGYPREESFSQLSAKGLIRERDVAGLLAKRQLGCPRSARGDERLRQLGLGSLSELHSAMLATAESPSATRQRAYPPASDASSVAKKFDDQRRWKLCQHGAESMSHGPLGLSPLRTRLLTPVRNVRARIARLSLASVFTAPTRLQANALPRQAGLLTRFIAVNQQTWRFSPAWRRVLSELVSAASLYGHTSVDIIAHILAEWRLPQQEMQSYIQHVVHSLPDCGGEAITRVANLRPADDEPIVQAAAHHELLDWVAIQMWIDFAALKLHYQSSDMASVNWPAVFESCSQASLDELLNQRATRQLWLFRLSRKLDWSVDQLAQLTPACWRGLHEELDAFPAIERRRLLLEAIELEHSTSVFRSIRNARERAGDGLVVGAAAHAAPRFQLLACSEPSVESLRRHVESLVPAAETYGVPGFFNVPLSLRLSEDPQAAGHCPKHVRAAQHMREQDIETHTQQQPHEALSKGQDGSVGGNPKVEEMAGIVGRLLKDSGLTGPFAPVVVVLGHGTKQRRGGKKQSVQCTFCNGMSSSPNARLFAQMANDQRVRALLSEAGIRIGQYTRFVAAVQYECDGSVEFFEQQHLPVPLRPAYFDAARALQQACRLSYKEASVEPLHEQVCIVGRRELTRGASLKPGTTLISYDASEDDSDGEGLRRLLSVVVPVSAQLNLRHWVAALSRQVRSDGGLIGQPAAQYKSRPPLGNTAESHASASHVPKRTMFVIEVAPEMLLRILAEQPWVGGYFRNSWLRLASLHGGKFFEYRDGFFAERAPVAPLVAG